MDSVDQDVPTDDDDENIWFGVLNQHQKDSLRADDDDAVDLVPLGGGVIWSKSMARCVTAQEQFSVLGYKNGNEFVNCPADGATLYESVPHFRLMTAIFLLCGVPCAR
jgi:hypothetical protein